MDKFTCGECDKKYQTKAFSQFGKEFCSKECMKKYRDKNKKEETTSNKPYLSGDRSYSTGGCC